MRHSLCRLRTRQGRGNAVVALLAGSVLAVTLSVFAIDAGYYYVHRNQLQTSADAGALAGVRALFGTTGGTANTIQFNAYNNAIAMAENNEWLTDVTTDNLELGNYDFTNRTFTTSASTTQNKFNGGYNAVHLDLWPENQVAPQLPAVIGQVLGLDFYDIGAEAMAAFDNRVSQITNGGLRPIYGCQAQWNLANADGNLSNNVVRIYGEKFMLDGSTVSCPAPTSGNWGFADLRNCNPGAVGQSTMADWFANGYPGTVVAGQCYSTQPGNAITSNGTKTAITNLMNKKTVFTIPLASTFNGTGSNTNVNVSGFTGFVITSFQATGNANNRYIEGYFTRSYCGSKCRTASTAQPGGTATLRLVKPG